VLYLPRALCTAGPPQGPAAMHVSAFLAHILSFVFQTWPYRPGHVLLGSCCDEYCAHRLPSLLPGDLLRACERAAGQAHLPQGVREAMDDDGDNLPPLPTRLPTRLPSIIARCLNSDCSHRGVKSLLDG
jgi:hypothetical protein